LDAFQRQVVELLPRLRRLARAVTRHHADADDLVQLTVERALARRDQWQTGTRLDSWMMRIMKNCWIDEARARNRRSHINAPADAVERIAEAGADAAIEARIDARAIEQAMEALPDEQRMAVALVLVDGLSYREAADVLEVPMGTLTSRLVRGRQALMARLEGAAA